MTVYETWGGRIGHGMKCLTTGQTEEQAKKAVQTFKQRDTLNEWAYEVRERVARAARVGR